MRSRRQPVSNEVESAQSSPGRPSGVPRAALLPLPVTAALWLAVAIVLAGALLPVGGCRKDDGPLANTDVQDASAPGEFLGNEANKVVHRLDCVASKNVLPLYRETFPRLKDAMAKGYRPCKLCLPHVVDSPAPADAGAGKTE